MNWFGYRWFLIRNKVACWRRDWPYRAAYWLPKRLALGAFIRVYGITGECGPEFRQVTDAWKAKYGE